MLLTSASPNSSATSAEATKTAIAPVLDGKLDDLAWKSAQVIDKFLEYEPKAGAETRFMTDVRVVPDDRYLYIMARMFDPAPDSIISLLSRRDVRTNSVQLKLVIDSYHDRRTAYQFITNPAGVKRDGYVSQAGDLKGIKGLGSPSRLEVVPYLVTKNETRPSGSSYRHPQSFAAGADVKYGISSNLTLNATVNPDFGQVEADPAVLNLSAFEQFFDERRPFFLEGSGIFSFNTNCGDIDDDCTGLFYSRRVGRSPQLGGLYQNQPSHRLNATVCTGTSGRMTMSISIRRVRRSMATLSGCQSANSAAA